MSDEIIKELWRVKDEIAKRHGYSIKAIGAELMQRQKRRMRAVVRKAGTVRRSPTAGATS